MHNLVKMDLFQFLQNHDQIELQREYTKAKNQYKQNKAKLEKLRWQENKKIIL